MDDVILVSTRETRLQWEFDTLADFFDRVGLHTNVAKTASMACQPCHALGGHSVEAYVLRMMGGGGQTYQDRFCHRVRFPTCNADLVAGYLAAHRQAQHRVDQGDLRDSPPPNTHTHTHPIPLDKVGTYRISFL